MSCFLTLDPEADYTLTEGVFATDVTYSVIITVISSLPPFHIIRCYILDEMESLI